MNAHEKKCDAAEAKRVRFLDNLRTFMIFLVVLVHAGGVYESSGTWASFWIVDDPATNNLSGLLFIIFDIFTMPTVFFISGFFAYSSLRNKSGRTFLESRFKRLMIPWAIAVLTLVPLYKVIFLYSRNLPQQSWTTYFHFSNGMWSQNWLWFLPVLFLFNALYMVVSKAKIKLPNISLRSGILAAFLVGFAYSFGMDMLGLRGWTKTPVLDFQNERLLIYFLAFLMGTLCSRLRVFEAEPKGGVLYHVVNATAWIPVTIYIMFLLYPWFKPGRYIVSETIHKSILWFNYQLSLLCLVYVTIETFRRYLNRTGKIRNELNRNSYYVYIIHVIVMGGFALLLLNSAMPSLLKHLTLTLVTFAASNLIISSFRRISAIPEARINKSARLHGELT